MAKSGNFTTINVYPDDRDRAREVKEARGQSWSEFIADAADELDGDQEV